MDTLKIAILIALGSAGEVLLASPLVAGEATNRAGVDFFEKKIRPVLIEQCYSCHSAEAAKNKKLRGGLYLDSRAGLRKGGESGPVLDNAKPADSLLLKALRHDGDVRMPPKGKLAAGVVKDFEQWLAMGAPDPRDGYWFTARAIEILPFVDCGGLGLPRQASRRRCRIGGGRFR